MNVNERCLGWSLRKRKESKQAVLAVSRIVLFANPAVDLRSRLVSPSRLGTLEPGIYSIAPATRYLPTSKPPGEIPRFLHLLRLTASGAGGGPIEGIHTKPPAP